MEEKLSLNDLAVAAVRESAKWCMFLAIIGFMGIAVMVLAGAFMSLTMATIGDDPAFGGVDPFGGLKAYFGLIYIVFAALYFFPVFYLYKYATGTKRALESSNSDLLSDALVNLKSHHKFLGIMTIIMISLYIIAIIGFVVFFANMASGGM
jgi:hypothetical protein